MSITEPCATVPFNRTARTATDVESIKQSILDHVCNRTLFVLTVVTVLALPLTIIPGLLGMNVGGLPLRDHEGGFWIVLAIAMLVSGAGAWWAFGRGRDS